MILISPTNLIPTFINTYMKWTQQTSPGLKVCRPIDSIHCTSSPHTDIKTIINIKSNNNKIIRTQCTINKIHTKNTCIYSSEKWKNSYIKWKSYVRFIAKDDWKQVGSVYPSRWLILLYINLEDPEDNRKWSSVSIYVQGLRSIHFPVIITFWTCSNLVLAIIYYTYQRKLCILIWKSLPQVVLRPCTMWNSLKKKEWRSSMWYDGQKYNKN